MSNAIAESVAFLFPTKNTSPPPETPAEAQCSMEGETSIEYHSFELSDLSGSSDPTDTRLNVGSWRMLTFRFLVSYRPPVFAL